MPDPITTAVITAAVSVLGCECRQGAANEAGKRAWLNVKEIFGWTLDPSPSTLALEAARKLHASPEVTQKVWQVLKIHKDAGIASGIIAGIDAEKVIAF